MPRATARPVGEEIDRPTPVSHDTSEASAALRIRALMWADWKGWIDFWGPVDPDVIDPSQLTYAYVPAGSEVGIDLDEPLTWTAEEVLPIIYGYGFAAGEPGPVAYRKGLAR